ncbi:WXG100-like domain-containing protein [Actinopolymorpha pittospori]
MSETGESENGWDAIMGGLAEGVEDLVTVVTIIGIGDYLAFQYIKKLITQHGSESDLNEARDAWTAEGNDSVKSLLTAARNHLVEETQYIKTIWTGPAAEAFSAYATGQNGQAGILANYTSLAACCDSMAACLKALRDALNELFNWLLIALGAFVAWAILWVAAMFGGVGVVMFLEGTAAFCGAVLVAFTQARGTINQIQGTIDTVQDVATETAGFPNSKWPRPKVALSDGSVRDGDASGWRVRVAG